MDHHIAADAIGVGQIYSDAKPPRHAWRVIRQQDGSFILERTDKPSVLRFLDERALRDATRYRRSG
jgi:hypothetical protein